MADGTDKRWSDRAWEIGLRVIGILAIGVGGFFFSRITSLEERTRQLEVKAAVMDEAKNTIMINLGEIKADIRDIKTELKKGQ